MKEWPPLFSERLKKIIPQDNFDAVEESFSLVKPGCFRINTLKVNREEVLVSIKKAAIEAQFVSWYPDAFFVQDLNTNQKEVLDNLIASGYLYQQGLSSMLVPLILDPKPEEHVLDMCAAPGSKTTQIAALMENKGVLVAIEAIKGRYFKLRSVITLLNANVEKFHLMDARRYKLLHSAGFDKILLDAPCSSEGRFNIHQKKTFAYWSERKIKEMFRKQRGLLYHATRLLKPGGTLVYSTCTFAPEENEAVIHWLLRKTEGQMKVVPIDYTNMLQDPGIKLYDPVLKWKNVEYHPQVKQCLRILPNEYRDGFFIAKLVKDNG